MDGEGGGGTFGFNYVAAGIRKTVCCLWHWWYSLLRMHRDHRYSVCVRLITVRKGEEGGGVKTNCGLTECCEVENTYIYIYTYIYICYI
jgi:hypothetical protein